MFEDHEMTTGIPAKFEHGAFIPQSPCDIPEGTLVYLSVEIPHSGREFQVLDGPDPGLNGPEVTDPEERRSILAEVVRSMREHPIVGDPPRWTREELHERS